jgi:ribosomal-protein-alanine N-acetyltransferase
MFTNIHRFQPFPILQTDRLVLRQLQKEDAHQIFALRSLPEVNQYLNRDLCKNLLEAEDFIQKINAGIESDEWIYWGVCFHSISTLIGTICLWNFDESQNKAELGVELLPEFHGKGLMTECLSAVVEYGLGNLDLNAIQGFVHEGNIASRKLMEKIGFLKIGSKTDTNAEPGQTEHMLVYQIEKAEI